MSNKNEYSSLEEMSEADMIREAGYKYGEFDGAEIYRIGNEINVLGDDEVESAFVLDGEERDDVYTGPEFRIIKESLQRLEEKFDAIDKEVEEALRVSEKEMRRRIDI
ncbi:MAG: hypothetical protein ACLFS3_03115 [Candidatus Aenigmatarchaeota archaeon]